MSSRLTRKIFYGWYIVAASVGVNFYLTMAFGLGFNVFFLPITREFGWSRSLTSGAFSLRAAESGLLVPVIGFLVDKWGARVIIFWGVVIAGIGMVMLGYINSIVSFYIAFLLASLGMTGAGHGVTWVVAVANWFERFRGRALGIAMLGPVIGGPCIVVVAFIEGYLGWRVATVLLGVGLWIIGIPLSMVARSRPEPYGYMPDGAKQQTVLSSGSGSVSGFVAGHIKGFTVKDALATRVFWVIVALFAIMFVGISGLMVHLIPLLEDMGYSPARAASILGLMFLLSGIGRVCSGFLIDLIDYRLVLGGLIFLQMIGMLLLFLVGPEDSLLVLFFALIFGIGFGGTIPLRPFLIMKIFGGRAFGALQGLVQVGAIGAGVIGPVFYGWVFDTTGSYQIAIVATMATVLCTVPLTLMLKRSDIYS